MKTLIFAAPFGVVEPAWAATEWVRGEVIERDSELIVQRIEARP